MSPWILISLGIPKSVCTVHPYGSGHMKISPAGRMSRICLVPEPVRYSDVYRSCKSLIFALEQVVQADRVDNPHACDGDRNS